MSYTILGHCLCDDIVLNVLAPTEVRSRDTKDSLYDQQECVFDQFPKYIWKFCYETSMQKYGEKIFWNQQRGMRIYIKFVIIMGLE